VELITKKTKHMKKTILHFHTGRGGKFNNQGHVTYCGEKSILQILRNDNSVFISEDDLYYIDNSGNELISVEEAESGVGKIDFDGEYDTDTCIFLEECGETELNLILKSNEYGKEDMIQKYFDECTDLVINWARFNGDYEGLITDFFNHPKVNENEFYEA
jgi:hypothetical protein